MIQPFLWWNIRQPGRGCPPLSICFMQQSLESFSTWRGLMITMAQLGCTTVWILPSAPVRVTSQISSLLSFRQLGSWLGISLAISPPAPTPTLTFLSGSFVSHSTKWQSLIPIVHQKALDLFDCILAGNSWRSLSMLNGASRVALDMTVPNFMLSPSFTWMDQDEPCSSCNLNLKEKANDFEFNRLSSLVQLILHGLGVGSMRKSETMTMDIHHLTFQSETRCYYYSIPTSTTAVSTTHSSLPIRSFCTRYLRPWCGWSTCIEWWCQSMIGRHITWILYDLGVVHLSTFPWWTWLQRSSIYTKVQGHSRCITYGLPSPMSSTLIMAWGFPGWRLVMHWQKSHTTQHQLIPNTMCWFLHSEGLKLCVHEYFYTFLPVSSGCKIFALGGIQNYPYRYVHSLIIYMPPLVLTKNQEYLLKTNICWCHLQANIPLRTDEHSIRRAAWIATSRQPRSSSVLPPQNFGLSFFLFVTFVTVTSSLIIFTIFLLTLTTNIMNHHVVNNIIGCSALGFYCIPCKTALIKRTIRWHLSGHHKDNIINTLSPADLRSIISSLANSTHICIEDCLVGEIKTGLECSICRVFFSRAR